VGFSITLVEDELTDEEAEEASDTASLTSSAASAAETSAAPRAAASSRGRIARRRAAPQENGWKANNQREGRRGKRAVRQRGGIEKERACGDKGDAARWSQRVDDGGWGWEKVREEECERRSALAVFEVLELSRNVSRMAGPVRLGATPHQ
jgi:hypothetical protein